MKANPGSSKRKPRARKKVLGVTTPKSARRNSAGAKQAPRARPRKIR